MMLLSTPFSRGFALAASAALALLVGCSKQAPEPVVVVVARVGDTVITEAQFTQHLKKRQSESPVSIDPHALLQELVDREVLVQNAQKAGLQDDPEVREMMRDVLISQFKERKLDRQLEATQISEEELKAAYEQEKSKLMTPERVRLAMLFLQAPAPAKGETEPEAQQRLKSALAIVQQAPEGDKGQGFGSLSVSYSEDQESRYRGGEIGWVERERYPARLDPAVIKAGFALETPGQVSEVIAGQDGFYLVKLLEKQKTTPVPLDQAEPKLRQQLLREKQEQTLTAFQSELRKGLNIEVYPDRIDSLQAAVAQETPPPSIP